jgi:hypothetical protein
MGDPEVSLKYLLELSYVRPVVGQPPPVEHVLDARQEVLSSPDIGPTYTQALGKGGGTAEDCQVIE